MSTTRTPASVFACTTLSFRNRHELAARSRFWGFHMPPQMAVFGVPRHADHPPPVLASRSAETAGCRGSRFGRFRSLTSGTSSRSLGDPLS
jgi:hypothetical protein